MTVEIGATCLCQPTFGSCQNFIAHHCSPPCPWSPLAPCLITRRTLSNVFYRTSLHMCSHSRQDHHIVTKIFFPVALHLSVRTSLPQTRTTETLTPARKSIAHSTMAFRASASTIETCDMTNPLTSSQKSPHAKIWMTTGDESLTSFIRYVSFLFAAY